MSYISQGMTEEEFRDAELEIRKRELELQERAAIKSTFWKDLATVASALIPVVTFLGLQSYFQFKARK